MLCMILFMNSEFERKSLRSLVKRQHDKTKIIRPFHSQDRFYFNLNMSL